MNDICHRWRGRRVLVTGCTGLLGSAVSQELLAAGVDVVGLIREHRAVPDFAHHKYVGRFHLVRGRAEDRFRIYSALAIHEAVAMFHLVSAEERATTPALEAACSWSRELPVIVARPSVARRLPTSNARLGIARFGELFGPGDRNENHIIPATLSEHFGTLRPMIPLSGPQTDFVFVKDAARACLQLGDLLTDVAQPRIVDMPFRSGWECSDRVMAGMVREVLAGREELQPFPSPTTNPLDWSPQFSLRVALKQTADWMREHCDSTIGQDADFPSGYRSAA